ncbi:MAG: acyl-CoA dehydrogenase family protein [Myxococcota bacterium]|nr:acyl-CoA dehydrogenase family protein [Myxococcota bacterium]
MDFSLAEDQTAIQDLARQIFSDRVTDESRRDFEKGEAVYDAELWGDLARANLLGVAIDEACDGMGLGMLELCLLLEEQGRSLAPVPLVPALATVAPAIAAFGTDTQRKDLLPGLAAGAHLLSAALEEAHARPEAPGTRASRSSGGWQLSGVKTSVAVAETSAALLVSARLDAGQAALFLVDPAASGVHIEPQRTTHRMRYGRVSLEGAAAEPLGDPARGSEALAFALERGRLGLCALALGVAEEALRRTAAYVSERKQFGRPIGTFQGVSLRTADGYIDVECMRSTLWQAAWKIDVGRPAAAEVAVAKWWACRGGQRVVHSAQHLHGGIGVDVDYPIHRFFLWAKQAEIELGGASQQLAHLGRLLAQGAAA